jgi:hypothetical protein
MKTGKPEVRDQITLRWRTKTRNGCDQRPWPRGRGRGGVCGSAHRCPRPAHPGDVAGLSPGRCGGELGRGPSRASLPHEFSTVANSLQRPNHLRENYLAPLPQASSPLCHRPGPPPNGPAQTAALQTIPMLPITGPCASAGWPLAVNGPRPRHFTYQDHQVPVPVAKERHPNGMVFEPGSPHSFLFAIQRTAAVSPWCCHPAAHAAGAAARGHHPCSPLNRHCRRKWLLQSGALGSGVLAFGNCDKVR